MFAPISVTNSAEIRLFTANDEITLEFDDRVLLMFTPDNPGLIPGLEGMGEYMRDTATVHIIDNDRNCYTIVCHYCLLLFSCSVGDQFSRERLLIHRRCKCVLRSCYSAVQATPEPIHNYTNLHHCW